MPSGRLERVGRFAMLAGGIAATAAADTARRWMGGEAPSYKDLLLSARNGRQAADALAGMRGAAMKLGQMLSLEGGVVIPDAFADALGRLRDNADTMPATQLRRVIGREYGRGWQRRFVDFDEQPVASASIGQVHRARCKAGRDLALKIQFPAVAKSIDSDVDNLATLLRASGVIPKQYDIEPLLGVVKSQLHQETDYGHERLSLTRYREIVADLDDVYVPTAHEDLTTKRVLAMDFVEADRIESLWQSHHPQTVRDRIAERLQQLALRELFETGFMQSDPNFGNYMYDSAKRRLVLLDFGSTVQIDDITRERYRRIVSAAARSDQDGLASLVIEYGWVEESDGAEAINGLCELISVSAEPLRGGGRYDFGEANLAERARDISLDLTMRVGFLKPPPPEMVFIQRKLAGTYYLCSKLGARVRSGRMAERYLSEAA